MQGFRKLSVTVSLAFLTLIMLIQFGCGGGTSSSGTDSGVTNVGMQGSAGALGGSAVKGPVSGATVTAYGIMGGMMDTQIASAMTDSQGNFSLTLDAYSGPLMLQMMGGTYIDEATGETMTMLMGDVMTAVIPSVASGETISGIQVTPLTSMAQTMAQHMSGGMTATNITAANTAVGNYFMVSDILHTAPMNPLVAGSGSTATQDMMNYGIALAAMSEYAKEMGMSTSSSMVTAMMNDASDGTMNGMMGTTAVTMGGMMSGGGMMGGGSTTMMQSAAGTSGMAAAMATFMTSTFNKSGVTMTDMQTLMNKLNASTGQIL